MILEKQDVRVKSKSKSKSNIERSHEQGSRIGVI